MRTKDQHNVSVINVWSCCYLPFYFSCSAEKDPAPSIIIDTVELYPVFHMTSSDTAFLCLFDACSVNVYQGSCLHQHTPSARLLLTKAMDLNEPNFAVKSPLGIATIVVTAFLIALDTAALGIRLWSRCLQGRSLCFNDYAVLLAWVCTATRLNT